jgi:hypothetical protein
MTAALLLDAYQDWVCTAGEDGRGCGQTDRTRPLPPNASQFHHCPRLHYLVAPLVRAGMDCKVVAVEWESWQGATMTTDGDNGVPYSSIETIRADGSNDCVVLAPCALVGGET